MKNFLLLSCLSFLVSCSPVRPIHNPFSGTSAETRATAVGGALRIEAIDVGQGDATLIVGPGGGKIMLIDGGPAGEGAAAVLPTLDALGIDHLNWIVATHYDADHIGGIAEVIAGPDQVPGTADDIVPQDALLDHGDTTDKETETYKSYVAIAAPYRKEAEPGMVFDLGGGATAEVIVVNGKYADGRSIPVDPEEENEACIGLLIRYGDFRYFTAGDLPGGANPGPWLTTDFETVAGEIIGDINILHAGHHGSRASSNEAFLEETKPEAAIISVGANNTYGLPAPEALSRIASVGATIYRTDQMGTIEISSDGNRYEIGPR